MDGGLGYVLEFLAFGDMIRLSESKYRFLREGIVPFGLSN